MEAVTGSILCAFLDAIFDRLSSIDWLNYVGQGQVLDQLQKLEKKLKMLNAVLADAEEMQTTKRSVEIWLTDLKHLAYDLEDVVDELAIEVQQRILKDQNHKIRPSNVRRILSSCCVAVNPTTVKFNMEMISKINIITAKLDEIIKQKDDLNLRDSDIRRVTQVSERPPSTSLVNEAKVYGRNEDKKAVLKLLEAADGDANVNVAVVPIIGMGGVGKTTLAQLIYNDNSLQFDFKAWVCVGEDFDVFRTTKTILQSVADNDDKDKDKDLNSLQVKLKQKLCGRKFLIILDDVWSEKYEDWTLLCGPFEAGAPRSKIIITTRLQNVADMTAGTFTTGHKLKELSYDECLFVFCQHALGTTNFDQHLDFKAIGEEIVKRCKGLPLAAKALGGLLRGKSNTNAWEEVLKSEIWDLPDNKSNILPALRLSYLHLPPPLKRCFAYCSIFPKDYEFDRNELVLLWMAEGFLCQQNKMKQKDDLGNEYFDELLSRSFFQQSNDRYVMHDLINDLAHFVSTRDTCFHLVENVLADVESYAHIRHSAFISRKYNISRRFECFYKMMKLRTFFSLHQSRYYRRFLGRKVLYDLLPKLLCLRVLSLTDYDIEDLPSGIGELKQLRFLNLSGTRIKRLPESIGKLFHLETLNLRACSMLIELPKSICNLTNLLYLDISKTVSLNNMPPQIGNLRSLRMLSKFIVGEGNDRLKISELKKLSQLAGKLEIEGLQNVGDVKDGNLIKEKPELLELYLRWYYYNTVKNSNIQDEQTLKSLEPHQNTWSVSISGFGGRQFPYWVGDPIFSKLVKLQLLSCEHIKLFPPLGRLPSLKELKIRGLSGVEEVGSEFYGDASYFPCLESLEIQDMSEWKEWSWCNALNEDSVGRFHKLRKLMIKCCPKLVGKLPSFLPSLEQLEISGCQQLTDLPRVLPSLKKLYIHGCREAVLRNLATGALQKLEISECDELKYLWADGTDLDHLTSLKHLKISSCKELVSLVNVGGLLPLGLEYLNLSHCERLKEFPNGLHSLKNLYIENCPSLEVVCDSEMSSLEAMEVRGCKSVSCSPYNKV
ncbi:putative disease resistance RPP13-like protein 1 isoform X2 [Euphorbia lathyris]